MTTVEVVAYPVGQVSPLDTAQTMSHLRSAFVAAGFKVMGNDEWFEVTDAQTQFVFQVAGES